MKQSKPVTYRVLPNSEKGWAVKKDGAKRALQNFKRKQDAINRAREVSRNQGAELQIHKKDGTIQRRDSHGNDPYPPRG